jgi:hypothetical protein
MQSPGSGKARDTVGKVVGVSGKGKGKGKEKK